jgi:hypothetical protein
MPLIHDNPWLVSQLLKSATDEEKRLNQYKRGQAPPNPQIAGALRALLNSLRDQITPLAEGKDQVGNASGGAELASHHMDSMGDLVEWMAANGTRIGGTTIVVPGTGDRPSEDYGHYKIEPGTEIVTPLARPDRTVKAYWINPTALKQYLVGLQSDPKLKGNPIFQVQLLKLVQDANNQLDLDMSESYQAPEKEDNYPLDQTPKVFAAQDSRPGTELLTYGDLKSPETFNAWLIAHSIGVGNDKNTLKDNPDQFMRSGGHCAALNYLNYRAIAHMRASVRAEDTERFKIMIGLLQKLAPLYQCSLSGGTQPGQQQGQQQGGGQITPRALVGMATMKPFNTQRIDFQELTTFLDKYVQLKPSMDGLVLQAKNAMQQANGVMNSPGAPFPVGNVTKQALETRTRNPKLLLQYLHDVIDISGRVYMDFYNECQNVLRDQQGGNSIIAGVEEQIASGGPYQYNLSAIERLQEQYPASG